MTGYESGVPERLLQCPNFFGNRAVHQESSGLIIMMCV